VEEVETGDQVVVVECLEFLAEMDFVVVEQVETEEVV
jgi:ribosomal protein S17